MTHRAVAERAGLRASAPSYFFPSIDDLIVTAFRTVMNDMLADLAAPSARIDDERMTREQAVCWPPLRRPPASGRASTRARPG